MPYEHLKITRETPQTQRHPRKYFPPPPPQDVRGHARSLTATLTQARSVIDATQAGGFDARKLIKIKLREPSKILPPFEQIAGLEIVSQEDGQVILAFGTEEALDTFEARLATLAQDGAVTRKELLFAIQAFDAWGPEDRRGRALAERGVPAGASVVLDVELWPQERVDRRTAALETFLAWLQGGGGQVLDTIRQPSLLMVRVRCNAQLLDRLLEYRDVRTVDLPPRIGVSIDVLRTPIDALPETPAPPQDAETIVVLDSGVTGGHPLLRPALGDAQSFVRPGTSDDAPPWHGTFVSGLALYGDVEAQVLAGDFVPQLRLCSGKVFRDDGADETRFVESCVEEAVEYFRSNYGSRVFNLSYGDLNKVYDGRHLRGLAYTLDRITRERGVLFVVPTGNLQRSDLPQNLGERYPGYLLEEFAKLLDPAPALNAITVGGLSQNEATRAAQRRPEDLEDRPIARTGEPFPQTRAGPSIGGAVKPDFVENAGNVAVGRGGQLRWEGLGVLSLNGGFAAGFPFSEDSGTSFASPQIAHRAARIWSEVEDADANLVRSLLGAHSMWPLASEALLNGADDAEGRDRMLRLVGYGRVSDDTLLRSDDDCVSLLSQERIAIDQHHFYELPIPASFWSRGRRTRTVTISLAYTPPVRTTRMEYRMTRVSFSLVDAPSLDIVTTAFNRNRDEGMSERSTGRWLASTARNTSTLQVSRWTFRNPLADGKKLFVVVTRQDPEWSIVKDSPEPYSLVVKVDDRENLVNTLYTDIRALLVARAQVRARARVTA